MVYLVVVVGFVVVDCVGDVGFVCCSRFCGSWRVSDVCRFCCCSRFCGS